MMFIMFNGCAIKQTYFHLKENTNAVPKFEQYLNLFEEIKSTDTICLECRYLNINTNDTSIQIGKKVYNQYLGSFIPLFQTFPLYKIQCPEGCLVFLFHYYDATYITTMYIEAISYDTLGTITSREIFPAWDGYGGAEQSESYSNNATISITRLSLNYLWIEKSDNKTIENKKVTFLINQRSGILEKEK